MAKGTLMKYNDGNKKIEQIQTIQKSRKSKMTHFCAQQSGEPFS